MIRVFFGVPESYGNTYWALLGHTGKKEKGLKGGRTPPLGLVRIGLGKGGRPLLSFSFSLPFFLFHVGGGILPGLGSPSRIPHFWRAQGAGRPPLLHPLYTGAGGHPTSLVQFGPDHGEGCGHLLRPFSPVLRKISESLGTFPMSEYSHPIYRSLCLGHFETPRHVPDLIWDSELPSVYQIT